jgi:signal transduction histidine kinase
LPQEPYLELDAAGGPAHSGAPPSEAQPHQHPDPNPGDPGVDARAEQSATGSISVGRLERLQRQRPLFVQTRWFVQLRWIAGIAVLLFSGFDWGFSHHFPYAPRMFAVGVGILLYNTLFWALFHSARSSSSAPWTARPRPLIFLAWAQITLDMACLTLLTLCTGAYASPLLGFFVFHMVFASLLLPRPMAFSGALAAIAMLGIGLALTHQLPTHTNASLILVGWATTLFFTIYIANVITQDLHRHRRRLIRKNHRIRHIRNQLQRHQLALVQQEKMAGLGQMAAGVAHEIANPLASMDSVLQLMQRKPDKVTPQNIETLREQVARIHRTVRQMTAFAHPVDDQWRTVPFNDVIREALRLVRMDARAKRATIREDLSPDAGGLTMLPQAMEQVLVNLMLNALDAMADVEAPVLSIRTGRSERWCWVEVTDNGQGIKPEHITKLFEPFFTTKPVGKGTGLGLSISYSLVRKHRGDIQVRSKFGEGSTFTVRLPAVGK